MDWITDVFINKSRVIMYETLRAQIKCKDVEQTKLILLSELLRLTIGKVKVNEVLKPLGQLIRYYKINISVNDCQSLKQAKTNDDILIHVANIIQNKEGFAINLIYIVRTLASYNYS